MQLQCLFIDELSCLFCIAGHIDLEVHKRVKKFNLVVWWRKKEDD